MLVFSCSLIPLQLAFHMDSVGYNVVNAVIDILFLVDMIATFNTAFMNDDF